MSKKKENTEVSTVQGIDKLLNDSVDLIRYARGLAARQVNIIQLLTYYTLGKWIVEVEQGGEERAAYGKKVVQGLSNKLNEKYEKGFSTTNLKYARQFYLTYKDRISQTVFDQLTKEPPFSLPWSHYLQLMRIEDDNERSFYEIEATSGNWSIRTLQRQYNSSYYERLALSRDKDGVKALAVEGNQITKSIDIIKQPTVLEFLGLDEKDKYVESDLETAIINKLQKFLLEMRKGYLFEARQKRFTFEEDNYYDRYEKTEDENPTIGILLCREKNEALVEITLPENANIYASEYKLYLPDKKLLQQKLREWLAEEGADEDEV